ncbi:MAG: hypothetical protein V3U72_03850 [Candidatus Aenigmarchaeota archaeon]
MKETAIKPLGKKNYLGKDDVFVDPEISMNASKSYVNEGSAYKSLLGIGWDLIKKILGISDNPESDGTGDYANLIPEEYAQNELGTSKPVLGINKNGKKSLTDNPLNNYPVIAEFTKFHEEGHDVYNSSNLYSLTADPELFSDTYALNKMVTKYGGSVADLLLEKGVIDQSVLKNIAESRSLKNLGVFN